MDAKLQLDIPVSTDSMENHFQLYQKIFIQKQVKLLKNAFGVNSLATLLLPKQERSRERGKEASEKAKKLFMYVKFPSLLFLFPSHYNEKDFHMT